MFKKIKDALNGTAAINEKIQLDLDLQRMQAEYEEKNSQRAAIVLPSGFEHYFHAQIGATSTDAALFALIDALTETNKRLAAIQNALVPPVQQPAPTVPKRRSTKRSTGKGAK